MLVTAIMGRGEGRAEDKTDRTNHDGHVTSRRDASVCVCLFSPLVHSLTVLILTLCRSDQDASEHANTKGQVCGTSTKT